MSLRVLLAGTALHRMSAVRLDQAIAKEHQLLIATGEVRPEYHHLLDERRKRIVKLPPKRGRA